MHIMLLSQYFPPETGSASLKMAEMAHYLTGRGHQVSVVSQIPSYPTGVTYPGYKGAWFRRELNNGFRITRTWSYASPERQQFWPRFWNYASFSGTAIGGILAGPRPDIILVYSPPLFLGLTATIIKGIWHCPFVFWVNDLWPRAALSLKFMQEGALYHGACALERFIYREATRIFVYSQHMAAEVAANGAAQAKIECHPLWIDTDIFKPAPGEASRIRAQYGWGQKFVVLYGGNIGLAQGLDVLVASARLLREVPDIHFVIVGSGPEKESLMHQVRDSGLANVEFVDHQPKDRVPAFFSAADTLFAHLKAAPHRVGTIPEKILAYMACGRPVLMAAQEGAAAEVIRTHGCGRTVLPENPEALAQAISSLYRSRLENEPLGMKGRQAIETHFSGDKILQVMEASLTKIVEAGKCFHLK
jgi:colanic acid biosynthesis glycosyl transferase WcaI